MQEVVVLGSGAFACEAMEAAIANNAKHVTMVCRDRKRYGSSDATCSQQALDRSSSKDITLSKGHC